MFTTARRPATAAVGGASHKAERADAAQSPRGWRVQRLALGAEVGDSDETSADPTAAVSEQIIADGAPRRPGQMGRTEFLAALRLAVTTAANEALGPIGSAWGCPYIERWFSTHAQAEASTLERMARRYSGSARVTSAADFIPLICARLRSGIARWQSGQSVAAELRDAELGEARASSEGSPASSPDVQAKESAAGGFVPPAHPRAVAAALGSGEPLPAAAQPIASAFGESFANVRVHRDARAHQLAHSMAARAFTVGPHIAFSRGEYAPGTLAGDALLAHELAHAQQQRGATSTDSVDSRAAEADADRAALSAVGQLYGGAARAPGGAARASVRSGLSLRRCSNPPPIPTTRSADLRAALAGGPAAAIPNAALAQELGYELDPGSRPVPPPPVAPGAPPPPPPPPAHWDGLVAGGGPPAPGSPQALAQAAMKTQLFAAFDTYLNARRAGVVAALAQPRVAFNTPAAPGGGAALAPTGVVDIANQARAELETRYGTTMNAAASSPALSSRRLPLRTTAPGQSLFDAYSEADRRALVAGQIPFDEGVAFWLFENAGTDAIVSAHHYNSGDDPGGAYRLRLAAEYATASTLNGVAAPNTNSRQLIDYRLTQWNERGAGITLLSAFSPGGNAALAERTQRWEIFNTAIHESLHLRTHPAFDAADRGRNVMKEGFTEMFTISTLNTDVLPRVRAGGAEPLRRSVEGVLFTPAPDPAVITNHTSPGEYLAPRQAAERIRDGGTAPGGAPHGGVGEAGVRAAYFQGHVEYLGLTPSGDPLPGLAAAGARVPIRIPSGLSSLSALATCSGVARATIVADNPGITDALPATAVLSGCREHRVVADSGVVETRAQIAAQNGVSEADLVRANPDIALSSNAWPALTVGQRILIPVH